MSKKMVMKVIAAAVAIPLALSLFVMAVAPAEAKGLTQLTDPNKIVYGTTTQKEKTVLKDFFNLDYYIAQNPDVVEKLGTTDYDALFDHFCNYGIYEGRVCSKDFDPSAYAAAYSDARDTCGTNILLYYLHYATVGKADNRTITTLEACAKNNITVTVLGDDSCKITPEIYELAEKMGITDYKAAIETKQIIDNEKAKGNDVVITVTNSNSSSSGNDSAASGTSNDASNGSSTSGNGAGGDATPSGSGASEDASGAGESGGASEPAAPSEPEQLALEPFATIHTGGGVNIIICRASGYAAYNYVWSDTDGSTRFILIDKTDNYEGSDESRESLGVEVAYIPVYAMTTEYIDEITPAVPDNSIIFEKQEIDNITVQRESSGTPVTNIYHDTDDVYDQETGNMEQINVDSTISATADKEATASTTYDVSFAFGETSADHVEFEIAVSGDDGFTLNDSYCVDVENND